MKKNHSSHFGGVYITYIKCIHYLHQVRAHTCNNVFCFKTYLKWWGFNELQIFRGWHRNFFRMNLIFDQMLSLTKFQRIGHRFNLSRPHERQNGEREHERIFQTQTFIWNASAFDEVVVKICPGLVHTFWIPCIKNYWVPTIHDSPMNVLVRIR